MVNLVLIFLRYINLYSSGTAGKVVDLVLIFLRYINLYNGELGIDIFKIYLTCIVVGQPGKW